MARGRKASIGAAAVIIFSILDDQSIAPSFWLHLPERTRHR